MDLNRRSFLLTGAGLALAPAFARAEESPAGVPTAVDGPLAAADSPLLKRVKFTNLTIPVGAPKPFRALHCSDSHLNFMDVSDMLNARVAKDLAMYEGRRAQYSSLVTFAACVLKARLGSMPFLHTGDVWDYHGQANYRQAKAAFDAAGDCFYAIGNHEILGHWQTAPNLNREKVRAEMEKFVPNTTRFAAREIGGVNFVSFDNTTTGKPHTGAQFAFLKREFAKGLPVVVMVHLPFCQPELENDILTGGGKFAEKYERRRKMGKMKNLPQKNALPGLVYGCRKAEAEIRAWLLDQPNLKAVLCGHLHVSAQYALNDRVTEYIAGCCYLGEANEIEFT